MALDATNFTASSTTPATSTEPPPKPAWARRMSPEPSPAAAADDRRPGPASASPRGGAAAGGSRGQRNASRGPAKPGGGSRPQEVVKTWAFDSVGNRKYALQIRRAGNGNPCLKVVEGVPQADGTFRKFDLTFWSEDWPRLFETLDELRSFIAQNNIRTPDGHKYDPDRRSGRGRRGGGAGRR